MIFLNLSFVFASFLFATRIVDSLFGENKIQLPTKILLELLFLLTWLLIFAVFSSDFVVIFVVSLILTAVFIFLQYLSTVIQNRKFRGEIESFVDRVILNLLSGDSFRASCMSASKTGDAFSQQELRKILLQVFSKQSLDEKLVNTFAYSVREELNSIDQQPHSALNRLKGLRRNLCLESEFRQKSEQIRGRVWVQGVFMLGLYIATLVFLFHQQEAFDLWNLAMSVTFFVTGMCWTIFDGRKMKWKT